MSEMERNAEFFIGTSGWQYDHWRGVFYPPELPREKWLEFYARHFTTVELNNSFYRLPTEKAFHGWQSRSPAGFTYAIKASRFITHIKRLKDCSGPVELLISRVKHLKDKLGPILYQLPPTLKRDDDRLETFLNLLSPGFSHVVEFRHDSWFHPQVMELLGRYGASFCVVDMLRLKSPVQATSEVAYIRFHGSEGLYYGIYDDDELALWATRMGELRDQGHPVYAYFNNDGGGAAIFDAIRLRRLLEPSLD